MKPETLKLSASYFTAWMILAGGFYALVLYPYQLDDLVKGAVISLMTLSAQYVFADQLGSSIARRQQRAFDSGLMQTPDRPDAETI